MQQILMGRKFDRALRRYNNRAMSPQEEAAFERWLDSLASEQDEKKISWPEKRQYAILDKIKTQMHEPKADTNRTQKPARVWFAAAAGIALVALASWLLIPQLISPVKKITPLTANEVRKSILADGTIVWLLADSKLAYSLSEDGRTREATLVGDALFEVAKDSSRPFIVQCGAVRVKVTGTSFSLHAAADTVMLTVLTGKVKVYTAQDTTGILVLPNEKLVHTGNASLHKDVSGHTDRPVYLAATEYAMDFTNATLDDVFTRIEKKFEVKIKREQLSINRCTITADFTDMSLPSTLQMIAEVHGITYTQQDAVITITGEGCTP
jgi:transmembrane sensor